MCNIIFYECRIWTGLILASRLCPHSSPQVGTRLSTAGSEDWLPWSKGRVSFAADLFNYVPRSLRACVQGTMDAGEQRVFFVLFLINCFCFCDNNIFTTYATLTTVIWKRLSEKFWVFARTKKAARSEKTLWEWHFFSRQPQTLSQLNNWKKALALRIKHCVALKHLQLETRYKHLLIVLYGLFNWPWIVVFSVGMEMDLLTCKLSSCPMMKTMWYVM